MNNTQNAGEALVPLERLVRLLGDRPGLTCTEIGETLWGGSRIAIARDRQHYARPAGKIVKAAMEEGLVRERRVISRKHMRREFYLVESNDKVSLRGSQKGQA